MTKKIYCRIIFLSAIYPLRKGKNAIQINKSFFLLVRIFSLDMMSMLLSLLFIRCWLFTIFRSVLEALLKRGSRVILACPDPILCQAEHRRLRNYFNHNYFTNITSYFDQNYFTSITQYKYGTSSLNPFLQE